MAYRSKRSIGRNREHTGHKHNTLPISEAVGFAAHQRMVDYGAIVPKFADDIMVERPYEPGAPHQQNGRADCSYEFNHEKARTD